MNPFQSAIVANPWDAAGVDVDTIHRNEFEQCLHGLRQVRENHQSAGLTIHGEAGSGKTHLLRRLRTHLTPNAPSSTERHESLYVWVRLQCSPRMIWRTVRRTLVEDWFRPIRGHQSQFQRILFHRLAQIRVAEGDLERWYDYMLQEQPAALKNLLDKIANNLHLERNTAIAFEHIAFNRYLRDLRAWLCGDSLPEAALARMDLAQDEGNDEEKEEESRRVVLMLCALAGDELPIVISLDQIEALQLGPHDKEALFAFGQLVSTLHDHTRNVLVVSCVQSSFFNILRDQARRADYDRMISLGAWSLHPLSRTQCLQLIAARLRTLDGVGAAQTPPTPVWPLTPEEFETLLQDHQNAVPPRVLLSRCAIRFDAWRRQDLPPAPANTEQITPPPAVESINPEVVREQEQQAFLAETWTTITVQKLKDNVPEKTDEIVRHGLPMLLQLANPATTLVQDPLVRDVELIFEAESGRTGVSLCTQANMTSLAGRLKRLKDQQSTDRLQRLVLIRDSRVPITEGAKKARQTLQEVEQSGALVLYPSVEALAALDALRDLLSDAKSGDLSGREGPIAPQTVADWLVQNLAAPLQDLAESLLGLGRTLNPLPPPDINGLEALNNLLSTQPVLLVDTAMSELKMSGEQITTLVEQYPDRFRLLNGPPATLYRAESREAASKLDGPAR